MHAYYFDNNVVVYKTVLVLANIGKFVYKIFVVIVVSVHLSTTWQIRPLKGHVPVFLGEVVVGFEFR